jgi:hypothetical protein
MVKIDWNYNLNPIATAIRALNASRALRIVDIVNWTCSSVHNLARKNVASEKFNSGLASNTISDLFYYTIFVIGSGDYVRTSII